MEKTAVSRRSAESPRVAWTGRAVGLLFVAAAISQAKLQTFERASTEALAQDTKRFSLGRTDFARRGTILSVDGKPVARDEDSFVLTIRFEKVPKSDAFFMELGAATGIPSTEFSTLAASGLRSREWRKPLTAAQSQAIQEVRTRWRADGVSLQQGGRRAYPLGYAAACFLGVVRDGKPLMGMEASQNEVLAGQNGRTVGLTDRKGNYLPMRLNEGSIPRIDGQNIILTIQSDLQRAATDAVKEAVEAHKADNGVGIIADPKTGDILAMANWPSFAPYDREGAEGKIEAGSSYNPAYMGVLEPGSTFKILTLARALDDYKVGATEKINCGGTLQIEKSWRIRCDAHHGKRAHGPVNPEEAISKSCNVSAASWALRVSRPDFIRFVEDLGLLRQTKLGLPRESSGLFNYNEYAKPLQLATVGFGQSLTTTPVALTGAFAMLANGGILREPRLIKAIGGKEMPLSPGKKIVRAETADQVMRFAKSVMAPKGTGQSLTIAGHDLAGKTGTAQKIGGGKRGYVSNFVGFVPADKPKAVVLVMIDNPQGAYYGAAVAGPVFVKLAKAIIRQYNIPFDPNATQAKDAKTRTR